MSLRKWVVRGLVALVLVGCLGAGVVYQQWTNPAAVRQQVVDMLEKQFPGATVTLDGARLRLLGGVVLNELRLLHRGAGQGEVKPESEGDQTDIVHIPQATVYHDKEQLSRGQFAVRRIEMLKPIIHIVRNKDGKWNVEGLTGKTDPGLPLPTIVIEKGTLIVEDRFAGPAIWELHDLDLFLDNAGASSLKFSGTGQSVTLGAILVSGVWNRASNATTLSFHAAGLSITKELVRYLASQDPHQRLEGLQLEGKADIDAEVAYQPGATPTLKHDVHCLLRQTSVEHPKLPVPLHNLSAQLRYKEGKLSLEKLKAAAGAGKIECQGWADLTDVEETFAWELTAYHLPLTRELAERLPQVAKERYDQFQPTGSAKVQFVIEMQKGKLLRKHCTLEPDNLSICFEKFKYPLDRVTGFLDFDGLQYRSKFEFVGYSGTEPVVVRGNWKGKRPQAEALIEITGQNLPLDDKLLNALQGDKTKGMKGGGLQGLAASFHPTGKGNFRGVIRAVPGSHEFQSTYQIHFLDGTAKWDEFPYPLENVAGDLVIYPRSPAGVEQYEFTNFKGTHHGGEVLVCGSTLRDADGKNDGKLVVQITGRDICLDGDLRQALTKFPNLAKTWDTFTPAGRLNFQTQVDCFPGKRRDMDIGVEVDVAGCAIEPSFFRYPLLDVAGQVRYRKDKVELTNFTARHNNTQVSLGKGTVDLFKDDGGPSPGFYAQLDDLRANPLLADEELLRALPEGLQKLAEAVHVKDQVVAVQTKLVVSQTTDPRKPPEIFWDGLMWVRDAELAAGIDLNHVTGTVACRGLHNGRHIVGLGGNVYLDEATVFKQPFQGVRSHFAIRENTPDVILFSLDAPLFGGDVSGQGRLELNSSNSTLRSYEVDLTASQIQLEEFGRYNMGPNQQLAGIVAGRLYLQGHGAGLSHLEGNGSIDVPYSPVTRLLNLWPLLDLLKFLGLRWPDRTAFEEAHAAFAIQGNRVSIGKLELQGNAVSLYGKGGVNLDGTDLQLDMYSAWGRAEQLLPSVVRNVPSAISKQLLKIEVRGKVSGNEGDLKFSKQLVPGLTEPLAEWRDRMLGTSNR